ncbi:MAG: sulfatase-like hydrolase/transferase [Myxococcales bacterium]|nr:sulfatase-like hydrolase/transferase [Myxococcales bacterium]
MPALRLVSELALMAVLALGLNRFVPPPWRSRGVFLLKAYLTLRVLGLIFLHETDGVTILSLLGEHLSGISLGSFVVFCFYAMSLKLVGIAASIARWVLMLRGQQVELPVRHIVGAFFIGRFLGTFLPSTLGLDGYKLYDASRFSGRTIEVSAATIVEKLLGSSAIFGTFLIALPLGIAGFPAYAKLIATVGIPIALTPLMIVGLVLFWPGPRLIRWVLARVPLPTLRGSLSRIADGASAYTDRKGLLLAAWGLSLVQHFTTAAMYVPAARALGVPASDSPFWVVTFASSIQILATVLSPFTIAGEGIRELAQGLLLQNQMSFGLAAASGLIGFLVAELPTLFGVIPWFLRRDSYRPGYCRVDGAQVDYAAARHAATRLGAAAASDEADPAPTEPIDALGRRLRTGAGFGLAGGVYAGLWIGFAEAAYLAAIGKLGGDAQVFWTAPLAYSALFGCAGLAGGSVLGALPFPRAILERWVSAVSFTACLVPYGLVATLFFLYRDVYGEQLPGAPVLLGLIAGSGVVALALLGGVAALAGGPVGRGVRAPWALGFAALWIAASAGLATALGPQPAAPAAARPIASQLRAAPNVLLISIDTLRADVLPLYGSDRIETPALAALAADGGTVFEAAFAQASWTKPSMATLLTSLYPSSHGATLKPSRLPDSVVTLAEAFREFGYSTGGIVTNINLAPSFNFQQGFDEYRYLTPDYLFGVSDSSSRLLLYELARRVAGHLRGGVRPGDAYQPGEAVNREARAWLDRHQDERFFLLLHYMEPHDPYFRHPDRGDAIGRALVPDPDPALRDEMFESYLAEVAHLDRLLGELFDDLRRRGIYDRSLIAVTSDHGEEFRDHGGWWHGRTLYDEQLAVPLLIKWPRDGRVRPPVRSEQVRLLDVMPTLLSAAGARLPAGIQGRPLNDAPDRERVVYAEENHEGNVLEAIRGGGWKLIRANPGNPRGLDPAELYELSTDADEIRNLAGTETEREADLSDSLRALARDAAATAHEESFAEIGDAECRRLQALGYVEDCD